MAQKGLQSPAVRKLSTILLFAGISALFILIYYFIYLPQQHSLYNLRTFRILHEITNNFTSRLENYGTSYSSPGITGNNMDEPITIKSFTDLPDSAFAQKFKNSFTSFPPPDDANSLDLELRPDSVIFYFKRPASAPSKEDTSKALSEIIDPIISTHANIFNSVLLIKQKKDSIFSSGKTVQIFDSILYKTGEVDIAGIDTDSILRNNYTQSPVASQLVVEGIPYRMFLLPFRIKSIESQTFVFAAVISEKAYRQQSQSIPVSFLINVALIFIILMLALPFLKIFVLSFYENINIADVRFIIAVVFIIPYVVALGCSSIWLYKYPETFTTDVLSSLQNNITNNFNEEIDLTIKQAKHYDSLIDNPKYIFNKSDSEKARSIYSIPGIDSVNIKDLIFYPTINKNIENLHWMDSRGNDVAAWNFTKKGTSYFQIQDRQYFKDIKERKRYFVSASNDTFSIQPTLSKLTGEYTITVALPSKAVINQRRRAIAIGLSSKMLSVYKTVIPAGYGFCLVDGAGEIVCHSDTARCLQENLFDETNNDHSLQTAFNHRDSVLIDEINLYDEPVKMMLKPLKGLPYHLVTYYQKRSEYLFVFHIVAFVFVCQSVLLLIVSLFSYLMMLSERKISKLFFNPATLTWLNPSANKREYYIRNCIQLICGAFFVFLFAFFIPADDHYIYLLNCSVLLPLFAVTGYYTIKKSRSFIHLRVQEKLKTKVIFRKKQLAVFFASVKNILIIYILSVAIYKILEDQLFYDEVSTGNLRVRAWIWVLIFLLPFFVSLSAGVKLSVVKSRRFAVLKRYVRKVNFLKQTNRRKTNYLTYFITSLLLSVAAISVIPTITFTSYALHEERKLHLQSYQMHLASRIQERREDVNNKLVQTKLSSFGDKDTRYADSLKFNPAKGLYLPGQKLDTLKFSNSASSDYVSSSPFYKLITRFLFLPPDHDEFYDNQSHNSYYYWQDTENGDNDGIKLNYKNLTDYRSPVSISLASEIKHLSFFADMFNDWNGLLVLLSILVFIFLFYGLISEVAKRIYLIGFFTEFDNKSEVSEHNKAAVADWQDAALDRLNLHRIWALYAVNGAERTFAEIRKMENELSEKIQDGGEFIVKMHLALEPIYEKIWNDCNDIEKYTLYNFALDGFTNYKKGTIIYGLLKKGLMIKIEDNFTLMTKSFRNFVITKETSDEIKSLAMQEKGSWASVRSFFFIVLLAVAVFIFISQEEATKRLITIATSLGALLPLILKLFDKTGSASSVNKSNREVK